MTTQMNIGQLRPIPPARYAPPTRVQLLPLHERPAARVKHAASDCNLAELLAAIVGGPAQLEIAERLLTQFPGEDDLLRASTAEFGDVLGVGEATAARLKAASELGRRLNFPRAERKTLASPAEAAAALFPCFAGKEQEYLFVLLLDTRTRVMGAPVEVYHGSLNTALIRIGEVFREAIRRNADAIIVAHNHPSGDPSPSPEDVAVTKQMIEAGRLLDIEVHDHLVIGAPPRFVSLKERGLAFQ